MSNPSPERARAVAESISNILNCAFFVTHHGESQEFPSSDWAVFRDAVSTLRSHLDGGQISEAAGIDFEVIKSILPKLAKALEADAPSAKDAELQAACAEFLGAFPVDALAPPAS